MYRKFKILDQSLPVDRKRLRSQRNYLRVEHPARPTRARCLGYKNVPGMIVIQGRIRRGGINPMIPVRGRHPRNLAKRTSRGIALSRILAQRIARKYPNLNVLNYYPLSKDGQYHYYQFILYHPGKTRTASRPHNWIFR